MAAAGMAVRLAAVLLVAAALLPPPRPAAAEPVVVGQIDVSFYAVTAAVVAELLDRLGHDVEIRAASHAPAYAALGEGAVDLLVAAWLPHAHAGLWEQHGAAAMEIATLYEGAELAWAVPGYVPEDEVASVDDLRRPEVQARMTPVIQGVGADSGIMMRSRRMMEEYRLAEAGYELRSGTNADRAAAVAAAVDERRWVVVPVGRPMYLNPAYDLRPLDEPLGLLGEANRAVLVGRRDLAEKLPAETMAALARLHLGRDAVEAMDVMVEIDGMTPAEAARAWMAANPDVVGRWFAGR